MASRTRLRFDLRPLDLILGGTSDELAGPTRYSQDQITARITASVGLAALAGLPVLIILSLAVNAPLAGAAIIASGYLAIGMALASRHQRRAAAMNAALLFALVGWSFVVFADRPLSWEGFAAALLAPLFAAAPAAVRFLFAPRAGQETLAALASVNCLDRLSPSEAVLLLDKDGRLKAATRSARARLAFADTKVGEDIGRNLELFDRAMLVAAIANCLATARPIEIALRMLGARGMAERRIAAVLAPDRAGLVSMRICDAPPSPVLEVAVEESGSDGRRTLAAAIQPPIFRCDLPDAIAFALRHVGRKAETQAVTLADDSDSDLAVACDRQLCRRIVKLLLDDAVMRTRPGGTVSISARRRKGVVLLRISSDSALDAVIGMEAPGSLELAAAESLVEQVGGTMLVEHSADGVSLSVRLDLAPA
jgi:signal transduction histidine kinase